MATLSSGHMLQQLQHTGLNHIHSELIDISHFCSFSLDIYKLSLKYYHSKKKSIFLKLCFCILCMFYQIFTSKTKLKPHFLQQCFQILVLCQGSLACYSTPDEKQKWMNRSVKASLLQWLDDRFIIWIRCVVGARRHVKHAGQGRLRTKIGKHVFTVSVLNTIVPGFCSFT